jgi:actin-like ATPase involved in cell morphogenesis
MSKQLTDLVAELINQGYAFEDIKTELDAQVAAREAEAKRIQEEAMAAQFQKQKEDAADLLVVQVVEFLNSYYPELMEDIGPALTDTTGFGAALVKELDESSKMLKMLWSVYAPKAKTKDKKPTVEVKKANSPAVDPITVFLQEFGL